MASSKDLYDSQYFAAYQESTVEHQNRREMYRQEHARIQELVKGGNVLDVGCGVGEFLEMFDENFWKRYGTDISDYALEQAEKKSIVTTLPENLDNFFDLIVFRGTIQHLDEPVVTMRRCVRWLKPGGYMIFLATPNIGGIYYRLFQELPMLDPSRNFMLVSSKILGHVLTNLGLDVIKFYFPYRETPYAKPLKDHLNFVLRCLGIRRSFAFRKNAMECYAQKPFATTPTPIADRIES
jgi:2-polyprenyl-3-methyl-5-hydroxy-6-metoxy-1,4-benzoquinol methylase